MAFIFGTGNNGTAVDENGEVYTADNSLLELGHNILYKAKLGKWVFTGKETRGDMPLKEEGDRSFEDSFSGPNLARRFSLKDEQAKEVARRYVQDLPEGIRGVEGLLTYIKKEGVLSEEEKKLREKAADALLKGITMAVGDGHSGVKTFVMSMGEEIGTALAAMMKHYYNEQWVENFVLVSGIGENFARVETDHGDIFIEAIKNGLKTALEEARDNEGYKDLTDERIDVIVAGIKRSNMTWERELLAAKLTGREIREYAKQGEAGDNLMSVGVSVGGTKIGAGSIASDGEILRRVEVKWRDQYNESPEDVTGAVMDQIEEVLKGVDEIRVKKIGIAFAGPVDKERGIVGTPFKAPNLPFENYALAQEIERRYRDWIQDKYGEDEATRVEVKVEIRNDGEAAVLGEVLSPKGMLSGETSSPVEVELSQFNEQYNRVINLMFPTPGTFQDFDDTRNLNVLLQEVEPDDQVDFANALENFMRMYNFFHMEHLEHNEGEVTTVYLQQTAVPSFRSNIKVFDHLLDKYSAKEDFVKRLTLLREQLNILLLNAYSLHEAIFRSPVGDNFENAVSEKYSLNFWYSEEINPKGEMGYNNIKLLVSQLSEDEQIQKLASEHTDVYLREPLPGNMGVSRTLYTILEKVEEALDRMNPNINDMEPEDAVVIIKKEVQKAVDSLKGESFSSPVEVAVSLDGGARLQTSLNVNLLSKLWSPSDPRRKHYQFAQDYQIVKAQEGQLKLLGAPRWTKTRTPLSDVDGNGVDDTLGILDKIKELDALRKKEGEPLRTIRVLDWGAGEGVALIALKKWLNEAAIPNVELIGYSDIYYRSWHNASEGVTFIFDVVENLIERLKGKKIDLIYSRFGMYHYTSEAFDREEVVRHFSDLREVLSSAGEIRSDFFYLRDYEIRASDFSIMAITGKLGTKMYPIKDNVEDVEFASDGIRDTNNAPGGIDLNPALLDLQIRRDGNGVPLPLPMQPIENMHIDGFLPVIINIVPITDLPFLLGLDLPAQDEAPLKLTYQQLGLYLPQSKERFFMRKLEEAFA